MRRSVFPGLSTVLEIRIVIKFMDFKSLNLKTRLFVCCIHMKNMSEKVLLVYVAKRHVDI